jgi:hypothetical protein
MICGDALVVRFGHPRRGYRGPQGAAGQATNSFTRQSLTLDGEGVVFGYLRARNPRHKDFVTEKVEQPGFETLPRRSVPLSAGGPAMRPTRTYPGGCLIQRPGLMSVLVAE